MQELVLRNLGWSFNIVYNVMENSLSPQVSDTKLQFLQFSEKETKRN